MGPRLLRAAERLQGHAERTEAVGLPVGVVQLLADGQALLQAVERVLVAALPLVGDAEGAEAGGLTCAVAEYAAVVAKRLGDDGMITLVADHDANGEVMLVRPDAHLGWRGRAAPDALDR